ncbi:hypothetical protein C8035_v002738 [Colletotrichum spinosum]|uniref:Uncharacterized protein n=1 Tax=Colletotrichum spinosum TaxID=1347390 RepID=A0A4R8Q132_9PEZI|nr:hypothetical protein C8035_v002738 [Colletotrichum spinosum]
MAANALAARSMGYCLNEAGDGGAIGRTQFCCDSQFDFRLNEAGICNIPADMCGGISRCCGNGFFVFNTCPNTFPWHAKITSPPPFKRIPSQLREGVSITLDARFYAMVSIPLVTEQSWAVLKAVVMHSFQEIQTQAPLRVPSELWENRR